MSWKDKIGGCFGSADKVFAMHGADINRAQKLICAAWSEGVGFSDFKQEIKSWLIGQGCAQDHVDEQIKRATDISSYFGND